MLLNHGDQFRNLPGNLQIINNASLTYDFVINLLQMSVLVELCNI